MRRGATVVECAIVVPVAFLMILAILVCGFGIFRYHQIEHLAETSARWLSLRGPRYQARTHSAQPTVQDVRQQVIAPNTVSIDPSQINCDITWNADETIVTVALSYQWSPGSNLPGVTFRAVTNAPVIQ